MGEMVAFGKYRVVQKRTAKGSWIVYDVVEVAQDRKAELRVYSNRVSEGSKTEVKFLDTLNRIAELDHPHIVNIWDLGTALDKGFYTVPPRDAIPLTQAFAERELSMFDEVQVLEIASKLCSGLQALHDAGIVHGALSPDSIYWDKRRCFPYIAWLPILSDGPDELRLQIPAIPSSYSDRSEDIYRLSGILHHILTGTGPLADNEVTGHTAAVNVPGSIDGIYDVLERGLSQDPADNYDSISGLVAAIGKVLSKQRVRAELEKSVSSMVIPQEVLEAALKKKKEQKRRRRENKGVTAAESPYVSPLEMHQGKALAFGGMLSVLLIGVPFLMPSEAPAPVVRKKSSKRPPLKSKTKKKSSTKKPKKGTKKGSKGKKKKGKDAILDLKGASQTGAGDFMGRWGTLKSWVLSLPPAKRRNLFTYGKLVRLRAEFKKDEYGACRKLDDLIKQAVSAAD